MSRSDATTAPHVQAGIEAARAVFHLGPDATPMRRAYEHIRQADALLHDVINGDGTEDERWHASEAHGLIHDAAAHVSPEPEIREIARKEATDPKITPAPASSESDAATEIALILLRYVEFGDRNNAWVLAKHLISIARRSAAPAPAGDAVERVIVTDELIGIALEAYDKRRGYSAIERMRDALRAVLAAVPERGRAEAIVRDEAAIEVRARQIAADKMHLGMMRAAEIADGCDYNVTPDIVADAIRSDIEAVADFHHIEILIWRGGTTQLYSRCADGATFDETLAAFRAAAKAIGAEIKERHRCPEASQPVEPCLPDRWCAGKSSVGAGGRSARRRTSRALHAHEHSTWQEPLRLRRAVHSMRRLRIAVGRLADTRANWSHRTRLSPRLPSASQRIAVMTERKKWRVEIGPDNLYLIDEFDFTVVTVSRRHVDDAERFAAHIVALNNAEGGDASSKDREAPTDDRYPKTAYSDAAGGPHSGGNAGREPAAPHDIKRIGYFHGPIFACSCGKTQMDQGEAWRHATEAANCPPVFSVVPEPPAEVEWPRDDLYDLQKALEDVRDNGHADCFSSSLRELTPTKVLRAVNELRVARAALARRPTRPATPVICRDGSKVHDLKRSPKGGWQGVVDEVGLLFWPEDGVRITGEQSSLDLVLTGRRPARPSDELRRVLANAKKTEDGYVASFVEPARPATPVIDETRQLLMNWQNAPAPGDGACGSFVLSRLRAILAEHDAFVTWAEGR